MRKLALLAALVGALVAVAVGVASNGNPINDGSKNKIDVAVFGDVPYSADQIAHFSNLPDSVNADPKVRLAIHLGDIKNGGGPPTCNDEYYQSILDVFGQFKDPLAYTPGDNEWTDCHRSGNGSYLPFNGSQTVTTPGRLEVIRSTFFPTPGTTLGGQKKQVLTQSSDPGFAPFVENAMWMQSQVVFTTLNIPGSNNDTVPWGSPWNVSPWTSVQAQEVASRTAADLAWIDKAFKTAKDEGAKGVVLALQADMWDPEAYGTNQLRAYTSIVNKIANKSLEFGKDGGRVLLLNGDSHVYTVDNPFTDPKYTAINTMYGAPSVPSSIFTRVTVQGSTTDGANQGSWIRLSIDPKAAGLWSFEKVPVSYSS